MGEGSITVHWGKPHRVGASPLRGYQVEHFTSGGVGHWVAAQVQGETFTLTEVLPDAEVVFLVRARNEHGLSPPSLLSDQLSLDGDMGGSKARQKTEMLRQLSTKQVELNEVATVGPRKAKLSWKVTLIAFISTFTISIFRSLATLIRFEDSESTSKKFPLFPLLNPNQIPPISTLSQSRVAEPRPTLSPT